MSLFFVQFGNVVFFVWIKQAIRIKQTESNFTLQCNIHPHTFVVDLRSVKTMLQFKSKDQMEMALEAACMYCIYITRVLY